MTLLPTQPSAATPTLSNEANLITGLIAPAATDFRNRLLSALDFPDLLSLFMSSKSLYEYSVTENSQESPMIHAI